MDHMVSITYTQTCLQYLPLTLTSNETHNEPFHFHWHDILTMLKMSLLVLVQRVTLRNHLLLSG